MMLLLLTFETSLDSIDSPVYRMDTLFATMDAHVVDSIDTSLDSIDTVVDASRRTCKRRGRRQGRIGSQF